MAESKFAQIAKMFGLELEEVFRVSGENYKFTLEGLKKEWIKGEWLLSSLTLQNLLNGILEVVKTPYRPKRGDRYFSYADFSWDIRCFGWDDLPLDYARLEAGMVFRTKDEACRELPLVYKKVTGKDW